MDIMVMFTIYHEPFLSSETIKCTCPTNGLHTWPHHSNRIAVKVEYGIGPLLLVVLPHSFRGDVVLMHTFPIHFYKYSNAEPYPHVLHILDSWWSGRRHCMWTFCWTFPNHPPCSPHFTCVSMRLLPTKPSDSHQVWMISSSTHPQAFL
jgi:hypothetical protein